MATTVMVVGGGVAGIAAALRVRELASADRDVRIEIIESSGRLGGKLRTREFAGGWAEAGTDPVPRRS